MSEILDLNEDQSLFDPIQVKIGDKTYSKVVSLKVLKAVLKDIKSKKEGDSDDDLEGITRQLKLLLDIPEAVSEGFPLKVLQRVLNHVTKEAYTGNDELGALPIDDKAKGALEKPAEKRDSEKNGSRPGSAKSA